MNEYEKARVGKLSREKLIEYREEVANGDNILIVYVEYDGLDGSSMSDFFLLEDPNTAVHYLNMLMYSIQDGVYTENIEGYGTKTIYNIEVW